MNAKDVFREDAWSSFTEVEDLCGTKILKVYSARPPGLGDMPVRTKERERTQWASPTALFL